MNLDHTRKHLHTQMDLLECVVNHSKRASLGPGDDQFAFRKTNAEGLTVISQRLKWVTQVRLHALGKW